MYSRMTDYENEPATFLGKGWYKPNFFDGQTMYLPFDFADFRYIENKNDFVSFLNQYRSDANTLQTSHTTVDLIIDFIDESTVAFEKLPLSI